MVTAAARSPTVRISLTYPRRNELRSYAALGARCLGGGTALERLSRVVFRGSVRSKKGPRVRHGVYSGVIRAAHAISEISWSGAEAAAEYESVRDEGPGASPTDFLSAERIMISPVLHIASQFM